MKKVFLDSSVIFTAVNSPSGGSSKLFTLKISLFASALVLTEVERNVRNKLETYHLERFFLLVSHLEILKQKPNQALISKAKKAIHEKDAVILAEAKQASIDILVSLDKKHFFTDKAERFISPTKIMTPKMLIKILS